MSKGKRNRRRREHERGPGWTAAADQADAQMGEVAASVRSGFAARAAVEGLTEGRPPVPVTEQRGMPRGPRGEIVHRINARAAAGELTVCGHGAAAMSLGPAPRPRVDAVYWLSWHPDLLSCPVCASGLPGASGEEDRRCDGCGRVLRPGETMEVCSDVTRADPGAAARLGHPAPALVCLFGLCPKCERKSSYAPA